MTDTPPLELVETETAGYCDPETRVCALPTPDPEPDPTSPDDPTG
jgi:hypothetical protein